MALPVASAPPLWPKQEVVARGGKQPGDAWEKLPGESPASQGSLTAAPASVPPGRSWGTQRGCVVSGQETRLLPCYRLSQVRYMSSTDAKVEQMFQILLDPQEKGTEKKQKVWGLDWAAGAEPPLQLAPKVPPL